MAFGFNQPAVNQSAPALAIAPEFAALASAEIFDGAAPEWPAGEYVVSLQDVTKKESKALIPKYVCVESSNDVAQGSPGSEYLSLDKKQISYLANWLCDLLEVNKSDPQAVAGVKTALPYIAHALVTKQPVQIPGYPEPFDPAPYFAAKYKLIVADTGKVITKEGSKRLGQPIYKHYWSMIK